jgi:hypothetical protein
MGQIMSGLILELYGRAGADGEQWEFGASPASGQVGTRGSVWT